MVTLSGLQIGSGGQCHIKDIRPRLSDVTPQDTIDLIFFLTVLIAFGIDMKPFHLVLETLVPPDEETAYLLQVLRELSSGKPLPSTGTWGSPLELMLIDCTKDPNPHVSSGGEFNLRPDFKLPKRINTILESLHLEAVTRTTFIDRVIIICTYLAENTKLANSTEMPKDVPSCSQSFLQLADVLFQISLSEARTDEKRYVAYVSSRRLLALDGRGGSNVTTLGLRDVPQLNSEAITSHVLFRQAVCYDSGSPRHLWSAAWRARAAYHKCLKVLVGLLKEGRDNPTIEGGQQTMFEVVLRGYVGLLYAMLEASPEVAYYVHIWFRKLESDDDWTLLNEAAWGLDLIKSAEENRTDSSKIIELFERGAHYFKE